MSGRTFVRLGLGQRGVALPLTLLVLLILSVLVIGFLELSSSEPVIANNHLMAAQARALAEAGVEHAIWALNVRAIPSPLAGTAPAPHDGSQLLVTSARLGGFKVTVTGGAVAYERTITAVGWVPDDTTVGSRARQKVVVTVSNPALIVRDPAAAIAARGALELGGAVTVDARAHDGQPGHLPADPRFDTSCGGRIGALTTALTTVNAPASVWGGTDGNDTPNEPTDAQLSGGVPPGAGDVLTRVSPQAFDQALLSDADVSALRAYARTHGTYLQHASGGKITFDAGRRLPDGIVFVDTVSGGPSTPSSSTTELAVVAVQDQPADATFKGLLFVNGSLTIAGQFRARGLLYAQDQLSLQMTTGEIAGAVLSRNIREASTTTIRAGAGGAAAVTFHCGWAKTGGGTIPWRWAIKNGTYREIAGS